MNLKRLLAMILAFAMILPCVPTALAADEEQAISLIPTQPNVETPNYVCTWSAQDWTAQSSDATRAYASSIPRDMLNHEQLFNPETGWCYTAYQDSKQDLIFLLDDGWDLPYSSNSSYMSFFASLLVDEEKFPGYGDTPRERLKTLVDNVKAAGWKGAGVWICANTNTEEYWRERLQWSAYAGVSYWKIDWGSGSGSDTWRKMISNLADEIAPELVIEHIVGYSTLNTSGDSGTRMSDSVAQSSADRGSYADVYRSYDVNGNLSIATTFERLGKHLQYAYTDGRQLGLLNGEDEVYMCSALGLTFGVMRYDIGEASSGSLPNIFFGGDETFTETRPIRKMLDEVKRATMWQRIAPAYRVDAYKTVISDEALADSWVYSSEDTWDTGTCSAGSGTAKVQKAPAVIARGVDMPTVQADSNGVKPFVAASRNPNGAISIGTYGRTTPDKGYQAVRSDISLNVGDLTGKIGVFGYYNSLSLTFNQSLTGKKIYAQDLMNTGSARDITSQVTLSGDGKTVTFSGTLLESIGLSEATEEYSEPGLVIQIGEEADFLDAPETIASSLIPNGSFEYTVSASDGRLDPRSWSKSGNAADTCVESGDAKNGENYAVVKGNAGISATASLPNGVYDFTAWVKTGETITGAQMKVSGYGGKTVTQTISPTTGWTQISIKNVALTQGSVTVGFETAAAEGEYLQVDLVEAKLSVEPSALADFVKAALDGEEGTNEMTAEELLQLVNQALGAYQGTQVTAAISNFRRVAGTDSDNGEITATITISNGTESDTVDIVLVIPRQQLVYNPSFEIGSTTNGDAPQGWDTWAADGNAGSWCYVEAKSDWLGGAHSGSWYGSSWGRKYECATTQTVTLPNGKYNVSVWVQNTVFDGTPYTDTGCAGYFGVKNYGGKTRFVSMDEERMQWTKLTIEDVVVTTGKLELGIYLNNDTGKEQYVKFDDFSIEPVASSITIGQMTNGTVEVSREEAIPGAKITVTAVPDDQYRTVEGSLKVYKTNDPYVTVPVTDGVFTMPGYGVTVEADFESATPQTYQYLPVDELTGYAESWAGDASAPSNALDGSTAKGSHWHSAYPNVPAEETEDNHYLRTQDGQYAQNNTGRENNPLGQYNNYYLVLKEAQSVDKISIYALWDNGITNGSAKEVRVYVSDEDYGTNKNIDWGEPVGTSPEGGFTYSGADDVNKEVIFDAPQSNVKSIRVEFIRTYANGGAEVNKWIRVMEFGVSAKPMEQTGDSGLETISKDRLSGYAESWQVGGGEAANALDGDTTTNWHSMYSGTETDENHIPEDATGKETIVDGGVPLAKYNNYYIVIDEAATVGNIAITGKYDGGITNGTVKKCNIYVSAEDYTDNQEIDWGEPVGSAPEEGFVYAGADDMKKVIEFAQAQENVKSIRIEVTESYSAYGHKDSKWIRVAEFDLNEAVPHYPENPALPDEDPVYTIVAVADYHTDYGIEASEAHVRDSVITTMNRIRQEENANVIVSLGDLFSANDKTHWFAGTDADREALYQQVLQATYQATESGMDEPMVMYIAGNHETEIGCTAFNSQSFVEDGTERTMGEMVAATGVDDMEANAYFEMDLTGVLTNAQGQRNVLAYHYNVDGLDFIALNPPYMGKRNMDGIYEYDEGALEWVSNKMATIGKDKTVVMIGHYPVGTDFRNADNASLTAKSDQLLRQILREYPNTIYLYAHVHDDYIKADTYETIVAYEEDARTVFTNRYSAPTGFISAFAGSMGYFGNAAGLVPQGNLTAQTPNYIQALLVYIYSDRIVFQMKNYGESGGELEPYTVMRTVTLGDAVVSKTRLQTLVDEANALEERKFEAESWAVLQQALEQAQQVLENPDATQAQVNKAVNTLRQAIDQLVARDTTLEDLENAAKLAEETKKLAEQTQKDARSAQEAAQKALEAARQAQKELDELIASSGENTEAALAAAEAAKLAEEKAEAAQKEAEAAQTAAETAAQAAQAAAEAAQASNQAAAAEALAAATSAAQAAASSADAAAQAVKAAENAVIAVEAQKAAQEAANRAEAARTAAEEAQERAEQARQEAQAAAEASAEDTAAAEAAEQAAQDAQKAAQTASNEASTAAAAARNAAQAANQALEEIQTASNEAMKEMLKAAQSARNAAQAAQDAAEQATIAAEYAAQAASAQRAAQEAQAKAEQARKEAEQAAQDAEQERQKAEAAQKAAQEEAEQARQAAQLETAKQTALVQMLLYTQNVDSGAFTSAKQAFYTDIVRRAMDDVSNADNAEQIDAAVSNMKEQIQALLERTAFTDVTADKWYFEAVDYVAVNGYMIGVLNSCFEPLSSLSRAQFATILYRAEGEPEVVADNSFTDVQPGLWYTDAILWASRMQIVNGYPDGSFGVNDVITREQMVTMLYRYVDACKDVDMTATQELTGFADAKLVSSWARDAMSWAVAMELIQGSKEPEGLLLKPQGGTTRAECAAIVQRFMEMLEQ